MYIVGHFLWLARGRKLQKDLRKRHRSPLVVALNVPLCSLDANISVVAPLPRTKEGAALSSENAPYRLLRVQFVASRLSLHNAAEND